MNGCSIRLKLEVHGLNCFIVGLASDWIDGQVYENISDIIDCYHGGSGARVTVCVKLLKSSNN